MSSHGHRPDGSSSSSGSRGVGGGRRLSGVEASETTPLLNPTQTIGASFSQQQKRSALKYTNITLPNQPPPPPISSGQSITRQNEGTRASYTINI